MVAEGVNVSTPPKFKVVPGAAEMLPRLTTLVVRSAGLPSCRRPSATVIAPGLLNRPRRKGPWPPGNS
jgi:hypothetical protein